MEDVSKTCGRKWLSEPPRSWQFHEARVLAFDSCFLKGWLLSTHLALEAAVLFSSCFLFPPLASSRLDPPLWSTPLFMSLGSLIQLCLWSERGWVAFSACCHTQHSTRKRKKKWSYFEEVGKRDWHNREEMKQTIGCFFKTSQLKRNSQAGTRGSRTERRGKGSPVPQNTGPLVITKFLHGQPELTIKEETFLKCACWLITTNSRVQ